MSKHNPNIYNYDSSGKELSDQDIKNGTIINTSYDLCDPLFWAFLKAGIELRTEKEVRDRFIKEEDGEICSAESYPAALFIKNV